MIRLYAEQLRPLSRAGIATHLRCGVVVCHRCSKTSDEVVGLPTFRDPDDGTMCVRTSPVYGVALRAGWYLDFFAGEALCPNCRATSHASARGVA